jgi:hypothetical protein
LAKEQLNMASKKTSGSNKMSGKHKAPLKDLTQSSKDLGKDQAEAIRGGASFFKNCVGGTHYKTVTIVTG